MRKLLALALAAVLLVGLLVGCNREEPKETSQTKAPLPDFTVYDKDNNPVKLSDFRGRPVVLNFWATWCGPCTQELPHFQEKYKAGNTGVEFMMVNLTDGSRETVSGVGDFLDRYGYTFPVYYDTQGEAAYVYRVQAIPTTFFISAEGYLVNVATGYLSEEALQQGLDALTK